MSRISLGRLVEAGMTAFLLLACAPATSSSGSSRMSVGDLRIPADVQVAVVEIPAPADSVWRLLPEVYRALGIEDTTIDPATRTYGTPRFSRTRVAERPVDDVVSCGNEGAGPSMVGSRRYQLIIASSVSGAAGGQTRLATFVSGTSAPLDGSGTAAVQCVTTGFIEEEIRRMVQERFGR